MEINEKILDLIFHSIISEGGDGDALWFSKHTSLDDLLINIEEYNQKNNTGWKIERKENCLSWGENQEFATITNDENFFNSQSNHIVLRINY